MGRIIFSAIKEIRLGHPFESWLFISMIDNIYSDIIDDILRDKRTNWKLVMLQHKFIWSLWSQFHAYKTPKQSFLTDDNRRFSLIELQCNMKSYLPAADGLELIHRIQESSIESSKRKRKRMINILTEVSLIELFYINVISCVTKKYSRKTVLTTVFSHWYFKGKND